MGNEDEAKSCKSEKTSPVTQDQSNHAGQTNIHVYPNWAAMQAYYGPRVSLPPYYSPPVSSGHVSYPYMWGPPQPMMSPYGSPYAAAIYPHGGIYAHPGVPVRSHSEGVPSSPVIVSPMSLEIATKSSGNTDKGLMKKLKGFDGLAMSIGNANIENAECGAEQGPQRSIETVDSSDGSSDTIFQANGTRIKRSREGTPVTTVADEKTGKHINSASAKEVNAISENPTVSFRIPGKSDGPAVSPRMTTLELKNPTSLNTKDSHSCLQQTCLVLPSDAWLQNERELKREKRKQSNRESARRSRLRKQAETEELACKVESLTDENVTLKAEIIQLTENSKKLRLENAKLSEKMKSAQLGLTENIVMNSVDDMRTQTINTENLLSRVNNSGSVDKNVEEGKNMFDKKNTGIKLHQLLNTNPRADAVAAG